MQAVERAHAEAWSVKSAELGAKTKGIFRYRDFEPETGGTVGLEFTSHTFGFR